MHQSPPPSSIPLSKPLHNEYREAKALPVSVLDHCTVCIEEQLFTQAFALLANSLTAGTGNNVAARVPPSQYLALAATLVVHPLLTTKTTSADKHAASDDALTYLKLVNHLIGPQNAGLNKAFLFSSSSSDNLSSSRTAKRAKNPLTNSPTDSDSDQTTHIRSPFAGKESLFSATEDFWALVGWAFNCSILHPPRWSRWKLWLDYTLDVLEDDLALRTPAATRACEASGGDAEAVRESLKESLLARYLAPVGEGRNGKRRVMRAVLADGGKQARAEFGEVWRQETTTPRLKKESYVPAAKRRKLDLENGEFGDYFDDESDRDSPGGDSLRRSRSTTAYFTSRRSRPQSTTASGPNDNENDDDSADELHSPNTTSPHPSLGGPTSLHLRLRLLALLTHLSTLNPSAFLDTEDLFDLYTEFLRPLPLPIFRAIVLPSTPWLGPNSHASLVQMLLRPLLAGTAPRYGGSVLTVAEFGRFYAPFAAAKVGAVENARVSVCVEVLLRLLCQEGAVDGGGRELRKAVEKGVKERRERSAGDGRRRVGVRAREEEEAGVVLEASAERMLMVLDLYGIG